MSHSTLIKSVPIKDLQALRQAVSELAKRGVRCELQQNAEPRMYYPQQLKKDMGRATAEANYVLCLHDAYYDVALVENKEGHLEPVFDDYGSPSYSVPATQTGKGPIKQYIGLPVPQDTPYDERLSYSIAQFLQLYTKHATINAARAQGYMIENTEMDAKGNIQITIDV